MKKNLRIIFCVSVLLLVSASEILAEKPIPYSFGLRNKCTNRISATITANGPVQFCTGSSVTLTASTGDSYAWSNGASTQSILVTESGSYKVTITTNGTEETSESISVVVSDNLPLSLSAPANITVTTDPLSNMATNVLLGAPVAGSACSVLTVSNNAPLGFPIGNTNVVWTITDAAGNTATAIQTITVVDKEKPRISKIGKMGVVNDPGQCGAVVKLIEPKAVDNSGFPVSFTNNAPVFFSVGTIRIVWTGTDIYGNADTVSQLITVIDNELPQIITTGVQVNNDPGKCGAIVNLGTPQTSDNCGVVSVSNDAPAFFPTGTTLVNWTVTDKAGYTNTSVQTVTVTDAEAPVFSAVPAAVTVSCANIASITYPVVTDNCDSQPAISFVQTSTQSNNPSVKSFYNYLITRTWTAKDLSGNSSSATQVITVADNMAPSLTVPANIAVSNTLNTCGSVVNYAVTATDNCGSPVTLVYSKKSGTEFATGSTVVTVTATDITGNKVSKSFTVTVTDTQKPLITAPKDIVITISNVNSKVNNLNLGSSVTSDNCGVKSVTNNAPSIYTVGVTTIIWTVKDVNGNTATDMQTVTLALVTNSVKKSSAAVFADNANTNNLLLGKTESGNIELEVSAAPNPSTSGFTLQLKTTVSAPVELKVWNILGNIVDAKSKLLPNSTIKIGENYLPGLYFAEILQGNQRKVVQLIKLR